MPTAGGWWWKARCSMEVAVATSRTSSSSHVAPRPTACGNVVADQARRRRAAPPCRCGRRLRRAGISGEYWCSIAIHSFGVSRESRSSTRSSGGRSGARNGSRSTGSPSGSDAVLTAGNPLQVRQLAAENRCAAAGGDAAVMRRVEALRRCHAIHRHVNGGRELTSRCGLIVTTQGATCENRDPGHV